MNFPISGSFARSETRGRCEPKPVRFFGRGAYSAPNMDADKSDDLFPNLQNPEGTQIINDRCMVKTQDLNSTSKVITTFW